MDKRGKIVLSAQICLAYLADIKEATGLSEYRIATDMGFKSNYFTYLRQAVNRGLIRNVGIAFIVKAYLLYEVEFNLSYYISVNGISLSQFDKVNSSTN